MSGLNVRQISATGDSLNLNSISTDEQERIIRSYCHDHPKAYFYTAIMDLFGRFSPNTNTQKKNDQ